MIQQGTRRILGWGRYSTILLGHTYSELTDWAGLAPLRSLPLKYSDFPNRFLSELYPGLSSTKYVLSEIEIPYYTVGLM